MKQFIRKHHRQTRGVLSGWDRIRFRGTIRMVAYLEGLLVWLNERRVLFRGYPKRSWGRFLTCLFLFLPSEFGQVGNLPHVKTRLFG